MNLCLFFEGTGQGVAGKLTNVTRMRELCVDDARQFVELGLDRGWVGVDSVHVGVVEMV